MQLFQNMNTEILNQYIRSIELNKKKIFIFSDYPFCLEVIKNLNTLNFHPGVTFIVGENGSGKSTLLEAIAVNYGFNPEGGSKNFNFSTKSTHSELHNFIKVIKGVRQPKNGYFLRAESFYNVATQIDKLDEDFSSGPPLKNSYGGKSLHQQSHGESFFSLFLHRFSGNGLFILDEPEAALSPKNQLAFLVRLNELIKQGSQFIIATHSPILMAYPNSKLIAISEDGYNEIRYKDSNHYAIFKNFINNPSRTLKKLLENVK